MLTQGFNKKNNQNKLTLDRLSIIDCTPPNGSPTGSISSRSTAVELVALTRVLLAVAATTSGLLVQLQLVLAVVVVVQALLLPVLLLLVVLLLLLFAFAPPGKKKYK